MDGEDVPVINLKLVHGEDVPVIMGSDVCAVSCMYVSLRSEGMEEKILVPLGAASLQGPAEDIASNASDLVGQGQDIKLMAKTQCQHGFILLARRERKKEKE